MSRDIQLGLWQRVTALRKKAVQRLSKVKQPPTEHGGVVPATTHPVPLPGDEPRTVASVASIAEARAPAIDVPLAAATLVVEPTAPADISTDAVTAESAPSPDAYPTEPRSVPSWQVVEVDSKAPLIGKVLGGSEPRLGTAIAHRTPSCASDGVGVGQFYVAAASHVGLSHVAQGTPRQDAYNFALTTSGRLVVAVADGMGSRPRSQVGATHFCDSVALAASTTPDDSAAAYLAAAAARARGVAEVSYRLEPDAVSFVGAVAVIDGDRCEVARIGDVSAFAIDAEGELTELFATDESHVNVVGRSLPAAGAVEPELTAARGMRRIVLATDGLANDLRTSAAARSWLGEVWAGLPTAHAMSNALRYRRRGSHDDRTAVVVAVPEPVASPVTGPVDPGEAAR